MAGATAGASLSSLVSPVFSMQGVRCARRICMRHPQSLALPSCGDAYSSQGMPACSLSCCHSRGLHYRPLDALPRSPIACRRPAAYWRSSISGTIAQQQSHDMLRGIAGCASRRSRRSARPRCSSCWPCSPPCSSGATSTRCLLRPWGASLPALHPHSAHQQLLRALLGSADAPALIELLLFACMQCQAAAKAAAQGHP
jgi:hypothetical protein